MRALRLYSQSVAAYVQGQTHGMVELRSRHVMLGGGGVCATLRVHIN